MIPAYNEQATLERSVLRLNARLRSVQWYFGMKAHIGTDAGTGYVHSVTVTGASVHDLDEVTNLVPDDDEVACTDAGFHGVDKSPEVTGDEHPSTVQWQVAARKGRLAGMAGPDRAIESRKASARAKHPQPGSDRYPARRCRPVHLGGREITGWAAQDFTATTVDSVTLYDLTAPTSTLSVAGDAQES